MLPPTVDALPYVLDWTLRATVLLAAAWAVTFLLRRAPAAARHLVWGAAVLGVLALPLAGLIAPRWETPRMPALEMAAATPVASAADGAEEGLPPRQTSRITAPVESATETWRDAGTPALGGVDAAEAAARRPLPANGPAISVAGLASMLWIAGLCIVLASILLGHVHTARLTRRARPVNDARLAAAFAAARAQLGLRRAVALRMSHEHAMPMTWGVRRPVVLLPAVATAWPADRLRAVLLHELAHVARHDVLTQLLARLVCALHWFNPLVWLAARKLREEREHACDDVVLAGGARASDYADHLLQVARVLRADPLSAVAAVAMARPSQLSTRLLAVLDTGRVHRAVGRRGLTGAVTAAAVLILPLAGARPAGKDAAAGEAKFRPVKMVEPVPPEAGGDAPAVRPAPRTDVQSLCDWSRRGDHRNGSSMNVNDDQAKISIVRDDCTLDIEYRGEIRYTEDDRDIAAIAPGGWFLIEERNGRERRELEIRPDGSGRLERKWYVNRDERPYGAEAQAWFAEVLPMVFRRAGINAEARATRILRTGGPEGLLQEIALIPSDHVARRYYEVLLSQPDLPIDVIRRVVREAGARIESDHELGRLLRTVAERQPMDEAVRIAYVEAAGSIGSDHEHAAVLRAILGRARLSRDLADAMLRSAQHIDSDHEVGRLLREFLAANPLEVALRPAFFEAFENIGSDHEQRQVLSAALAQGAPDRALLDRILAYAPAIGSDHERGLLLREVASLYPMDGALPASYLEAARGIGSDHELGQVLRTLIERDPLSDATVNSVLEAATGIGSDHELGTLLMLLVDRGAVNDVTRPAFMRALDTIGSEHTRGQVLTRLYPRGRPA